MPSVMIVDDEPAARRGLVRMLSAHADVRIFGEAEDLISARQMLETGGAPDAVFLDVGMPQGNGFELISALAPGTHIIFVTAHSEHAARAFDVAALDYLLKPVREERLAKTLERIRRAQLPDEASSSVVRPGREQLLVKHRGSTIILDVNQIAALRADGDFTWILIENEPPILGGQTLSKYADMLEQSNFVRVSRSLIVNLDHVRSLKTSSRDEGQLHLRGIEEPVMLRRVAAVRMRTLIKERNTSE